MSDRVIRECGWYWADKQIIALHAANIGIVALGVYHALCYFANDTTHLCYPSHQTIAKMLGISRSSVIRAIKVLGDQGLIDVQAQANSSNLYTIKRLGGVPQTPSVTKIQGGVTGTQGGGVTGTH